MTTDPLDQLRLPLVPVEPRPEFADALLRRIENRRQSPATSGASATLRYFVEDLSEAVAFYCLLLDFEQELRPSPTFAMLYRGDLRLLLSVPGSAHALADGTLPEPGGWNRMALEVEDLAGTLRTLLEHQARLRTDIVAGVGVRHVLLEDPSGNLVELFEQAAGYHERPRDPSRQPTGEGERS